MTAATIAPPAAEAIAVEDAWSVLDRAEQHLDTLGCECLHRAAQRLRDRLGDHDLIGSGDLHPASEFPDLGHGHPDDALAQALDRIAEEVADLARDLAGEVWEHTGERVGDQTAQDVAGTDGAR